MHKFTLAATVFALPLLALAASSPCHAQSIGSFLHSVTDTVTQKVQQKIQDKAGEEADAAMNGQSTTARRGMPRITGGFDFSPAPVSLYQDDFAATAIGAMPQPWKTNGSGQVVSVQGFPGKWLELSGSSTFKLSREHRLPDRFTIEFDLLPLAETPSDLNNPLFGFAGDDRATDYLSDGVNDGALNAIDLLFFNAGSDVSVYSGASGFNSNPDFNVQGYANRILHVSIAVDGNRERVWLDRTKILDSRMFQNNPSRYFFISAPMKYDHGAKLLLGNVRIGGYK
jgi:hypothetical protein